jgi:type I restriction enzyme, S subunit
MKYRIREQNELKSSGLHWIDYLPKDWKKASLKYILNYVIGSTPSTSKDKYFFGDNIWVSISDIKDKYISDAKQRLSDDAIIDCNIKVVPKGSLLYSFKLSVGQMSFNTVDLYTNEAIASFLNNENVNLDFWYYALGEYLIEYANDNIYGAKLLNQDLIKNARLLVPSKIEQQKIANFLDEKSKIFDESISKKEQLISKLELAKQSLISEVVTGKLKIIENNSKLQTIKREQKELKPSGVEWLGDIPKDWEVKKLKYLVEVPLKYGANESAELIDKNLPRYIRITDFANDGLLKEDTFRSLSEDKAKDFILKDGDVLFARSGGTVGKTFQFKNYNGIACFAGYLISARPNKKIVTSDFIYLFTRTLNYQNWKNSIFMQATIQNIGADKYNELYFPYTKLEEQKQISKYLDEKLIHFDNTIEKTKQSIKKLKLAKEALISQAVTGKIEVL